LLVAGCWFVVVLDEETRAASARQATRPGQVNDRATNANEAATGNQ